MNSESDKVKQTLKNNFTSASNIYVDQGTKECEVTLEMDDYDGELEGYLVGNGVQLKMIDYSDKYPFKYVFSYKVSNNYHFNSHSSSPVR